MKFKNYIKNSLTNPCRHFGFYNRFCGHFIFPYLLVHDELINIPSIEISEGAKCIIQIGGFILIKVLMYYQCILDFQIIGSSNNFQIKQVPLTGHGEKKERKQ